MAAGDVKVAYAAKVDLTVTNLHSLPTSSTWVNGWESDLVDNTSNLYTDYRVTAKITVAAASLTAGEIRMYIAGMLDDSNWPANLDGTESVEAPFMVDTEMQDAWMRLGAVCITDTTNSDIYYLEIASVAALYNGNLPAKFVVCIAHSTAQNLAASGNQVTVKGSYNTVAQS